MDILKEIKGSKKKPKELVVFLAAEAKKDKKTLAGVADGLKKGSPVEKGVCAEVLEYVSRDDPDSAAPFIGTVAEYINFDAPKVKWETSRIIANLAPKFAYELEKAVPKLLINTKDKGTVVRWSAALALTEIAKKNQKIANSLLPTFVELSKKDKNSGVKNIYLKTLALFAGGGCCG